VILSIREARDILRLDGGDNDHFIKPLIEAIPPYLERTTSYVKQGKFSPVSKTAARFILQLWYFGESTDNAKLERVIDCLRKALSAERATSIG
jgi:hypothetical protein